MAHLIVIHKIQDYATWKPVFDEHTTTRAAAGSKGGSLYRDADDPNNVVLTFEWDSRENAEAFINSDNLREIMGKAGVVGQPQFIYVDKLEDFQS
jgi:quinol monooxygenase YgiN